MPSFFFNDPATTDISPLPLPDALPICVYRNSVENARNLRQFQLTEAFELSVAPRSEEHTSELQSLAYLVCRLFFLMTRRPPTSPLFPYPTLFRSVFIEPPWRMLAISANSNSLKPLNCLSP